MASIDSITVDLKIDGVVLKTFENLVEENKRLRKERDAAVEDMRMLGRMGENICCVCANYHHGEGDKQKCINCIINRDTDNFEWRGVQHG